eukprot:8040193-Pyramimonas_sp.AAC.1
MPTLKYCVLHNIAKRYGQIRKQMRRARLPPNAEGNLPVGIGITISAGASRPTVTSAPLSTISFGNG